MASEFRASAVDTQICYPDPPSRKDSAPPAGNVCGRRRLLRLESHLVRRAAQIHGLISMGYKGLAISEQVRSTL